MARARVEVLCPYCQKTLAASGLTSHMRAKHPENYEEFGADKKAFIEANKVGSDAPTPAPEPKATVTESATVAPPVVETKEPTPEPAPKKQQTKGFLETILGALDDL